MQRFRLWLVLVLLAIAAVASTLASTWAQTPVPGIAWRPCPALQGVPATPEAGSATGPSGLACASVSVPLDYADPDGPQIAIGINRLPARDPRNRIGSLVFDPGGPGGSGVGWVTAAAMGLPLFTDAVRDHFDLIGLDPRGVGTSTPVQCNPEYLQPAGIALPAESGGV